MHALQLINDDTTYKQLTPLQEAYVQHLIDGKDECTIQEMLNIDNKNMWDIKRNPVVAAQVFSRAAVKLRHEVFPRAVNRLAEVLADNTVSPRFHISAAKTVLQYEQAAEMMKAKMPGGLQKSPEEMSQSELQSRAMAIRSELRGIDREKQSRAKDISDVATED